MKKGFVFGVLLGLLISGCAIYPGKGKPCVSATSTVINVGSGVSVADETAIAQALTTKAQAAQKILMAIEKSHDEPCYECPPRVTNTTYVAPMPKPTENIPAVAPKITEYTPGENWVFKWGQAESGYVWLITNPKYLGARPDPSKGQGVFFVGDGQGWYSKQYPMELAAGEYQVKVPVNKFLGRNRSNYLIMNDSPGDGIWAQFGPSDDKKWVKEGDYDTVTGQYKYCIIFHVNQNGTIVPSE